MHRLAKIKYPAVEGCQNYLVTRSNWIDHWVKAIQSGLVNTLAKGMAQSYTDLAAQHAIARVEFDRLHHRRHHRGYQDSPTGEWPIQPMTLSHRIYSRK